MWIHLNGTWNVSWKTEPQETIAAVLSFLALLLLLTVVVVRRVEVVVVIVVVVDAIFSFVPDIDNLVLCVLNIMHRSWCWSKTIMITIGDDPDHDDDEDDHD